MKYLRALRPFLMLVALVVSFAAHGQTSTAEFWPEIQLHYGLDTQTKLIALATSSRSRDSESAYEGQVGVAVDHRFNTLLSGRVGYRRGFALDGSSFREDRALAEQTFRYMLPHAIQLELRTREDFRWLDTGFSVRLRERLLIQREFKIDDYAFAPYVSAEVYYDTRYDDVSRNRFVLGATFPIAGAFSVEPYFARQTDTRPATKYVNAFGLVFIAAF